MAEAPSKRSARRRCRCGHDRDHPLVYTRPKYGFWAWVMLLNGATSIPKKVVYICKRCGDTFDETRDPSILRTYR